MASKQGRNFPFPIGVIMLPFLLASVVGIVVFSFNIIFADDVRAGSQASPRNESAWLDAARAREAEASETPPPVRGGAAQVGDSRSGEPQISDPPVDERPLVAAVSVGGIRAERESAQRAEPRTEPQRDAASPNKPAAKPAAKPVKTPAESASAANAQSSQNAPNSPKDQRARRTRGWQIQAGAFSVESSAAQVKNKIARLGYDVRIVRSGSAKAAKPISRVLVSPGKNADAPRAALRKLNSIGIEGYIISERP